MVWAGHFTRAAEWLEVGLLAGMAPLFVFPAVDKAWLFLVFPLIWIVRWGAGREEDGDLRAKTVIDVALLIICIQLFISTLRFEEVLSGLPKITGILYGILVFSALVRVLKSSGLIRAGVGVFIFGGVVLTGIGMMGMSKSNEPFFANIVTLLFGKVPQKNWGFHGAELGLNPNAVAGVMMLFVPLCFVLAAWGIKKRVGQHLVSHRIDILLLSALTLYFCLVLFLSQSIGSWLALTVSLWLVLPSWKAKAVGFVPAMVFVVIVLVVIPSKYEKAMAKQGKPFWITKVEARYKYWDAGLDAVSEKPVTGIGVNQLRMRPGFGYEYSHAHNHMLHTAAELGIPGLMAYLAVLMGAGWMCWEVWRKMTVGWMRAAVQGLGAGQLAHFIFGLGDSIPLGAKPGIFFWISLALIASIYNYSLRSNLRDI